LSASSASRIFEVIDRGRELELRYLTVLSRIVTFLFVLLYRRSCLASRSAKLSQSRVEPDACHLSRPYSCGILFFIGVPGRILVADLLDPVSTMRFSRVQDTLRQRALVPAYDREPGVADDQDANPL